MANQQVFTDLAEAVADGRPLDWPAIEQSSPGLTDSEDLAALRVVAQVGGLFASLARTLGGADRRPERVDAGTTWGSLRIVEHAGSGRYGDVYKAWDATLDRHVALKLVRCDDSAKSATPVVDEGRLMARVRHPSVVAIYGAQRIGDVAGLSMEFVEGRTLESELAARGPASADELARVARELAGALAAVHSAGLVHRDVKTSNVLVESSGRVVLGDFGTGQELYDDVVADGLVGTPAYVAPEIFAGEPATPKSDVYSLGVLLFRLATADYPQAARTLRDLRDAHESLPPRSLRETRPDLPPALTGIVDRALERDPSKRLESCEDMVRALDGLRPSSVPRMRQGLFALATTVAIAFGWLWWQSRPATFQFNERDWVLVTAFENGTDNPSFDDAIEYALELELRESSSVNVVPPERVQDTLALMSRPLDRRVDAATAGEVALRDGGIRAIVAGRIDPMGQDYRVSATVINPTDGVAVFAATEPTSGASDVLPAVGRLAARIRKGLTRTLPERLATSGSQLPRVTTSSIEALRLYEQALPELRLTANPRLAEELLKEAVREDPNFAVAHVALARAIFEQRLFGEVAPGTSTSTHRTSEIDEHLAEAERAAQNVHVEDRYRVAAEAAWLRERRWERGAERAAFRQAGTTALEALARLRPNDPAVLLTLLTQGDPRGQDVVSLAEHLVTLRPNSPYVLVLTAIHLRSHGETELARVYAERARPLLDLPSAERAGDEPAVRGRWLLFDMAWLRDDIDDAKMLADELVAIWMRSGEEPAAAFALQTARKLVALGELDRAELVAASILRKDGARESVLGSISLSRQDAVSARDYLDANSIESSRQNSYIFLPSFLRAGRIDEARASIGQMLENPRLQTSTVDHYRAKLALALGDADVAIDLLEPLVAARPNTVAVNDLADALVLAGRAAEAIEVLEAGLDRRAEEANRVVAAHHWLALLDRLGRLYRDFDRVDDADRVDNRLRHLLKYADDDHPIKRRLDALGRTE